MDTKNKIMDITFKKVEGSRANKLYLQLTFMHGDGDVYEVKVIEIKLLKYDNLEKNLSKILKVLEPYQTLQKLLHDYHVEVKTGLTLAEVSYGRKMKKMFEESPHDSTSYHCKARLTSIFLFGYDKEGNQYKSNELNYWIK